MPAVSCRDVDAICDWFFREDDIAKLAVTMLGHYKEAHPDFTKNVINETLSGKTKLSVGTERAMSTIRHDPGEAPASTPLNVACKEIGPNDCEIIKERNFIDLAIAYIRHLEDKHPARIGELLKIMPLSQVFENLRLHAVPE